MNQFLRLRKERDQAVAYGDASGRAIESLRGLVNRQRSGFADINSRLRAYAQALVDEATQEAAEATALWQNTRANARAESARAMLGLIDEALPLFQRMTEELK